MEGGHAVTHDPHPREPSGVCSAGVCPSCGCHFRRPSDVMHHHCAAQQEAQDRASWRAVITQAAAAVPAAYAHRQVTMRAAHNAGLSLRQIGEAAGLSTNAVSKIVGPVGRKRASLDDFAPAGQDGDHA